MWIEEIFVESFGAFNRVRIDKLGPGLNVIVGPNEAGKSTVLEFIRAILFGFRKRKARINEYSPSDGSLRKGRLCVVTTRNGRLLVERTEKKGRKEGVVSITDESGESVDPSEVSLLRGASERNDFESLFALDLDRLRRLDRESLRGKIVAAALGAGRVNPVEVLRRVEDRIRALEKRSSKDDQSLWAVQTRLREVDEKLKTLSEKPHEYAVLKEQSGEAEDRRKEVGTSIETAERSHEHARKFLRSQEQWKNLVSLDRRARSLEEARNFPAEGVSRLEQVFERRREASSKIAEREDGVASLRARLEKLDFDPVFIRNADAIHSLAQSGRTLASLPGEMGKLEAQLDRTNSALAEEIAGLGAQWTRERVSAVDPSLVAEKEILGSLEAWRILVRKVRDLAEKERDIEERSKSLQKKIAADRDAMQRLIPECKGFLSSLSRNLLLEWKEGHNRVRHVRERLADRNTALRRLYAEKRDLEEQLKRITSRDRAGIPSRQFGLLMTLTALAGVGTIFSFATGSGAFNWVHLVVGSAMILAVPLLTVGKLKRERRNRETIRGEQRALNRKSRATLGEVSVIRRERKKLAVQINHLKARLEQIAEDVSGSSRADLKDVLDLERRSSSAEEAVRKRESLVHAIESVQAELSAVQTTKKEISRNLHDARAEFQELKDRWDGFLRERRLDEGIEPEIALGLLRRVREIKKSLLLFSEQEATLKALKDQWDEFVGDVVTLGDKMSRPMPDEISPVEQAEQWSRLERQAAEAIAEQRSLQERISEKEIRLKAEQQQLEEADEQIEALLELAAADDEESFRELSRMSDDIRFVDQQRSILVSNLVSGLGFQDQAAMRATMEQQDWEKNGAAAATLQSELRRLREESEDLAGRSGRLAREIEALEADDETERLMSERERCTALLSARVRQWVKLKLASAMLTKTLRIFESEKQPKVLKKGSRIFSAVTGGEFTKVLAPLGGENLKVERSNGVPVPESHLSRGTVEQLYLALRLAHLDTYHVRDSSYPVVMDDVLVNFDPERARLTAEELAEFSKATEIQVLFFTCHPHIADLFPRSAPRFPLGRE